jgi:hypothetical protein
MLSWSLSAIMSESVIQWLTNFLDRERDVLYSFMEDNQFDIQLTVASILQVSLYTPKRSL